MSWFFESPAEEQEEFSSSTSSTTSAIGKNSDLWGSESSDSDSEDCKEENEVQSAYKGKLDNIDALEDALPIRRGISEFYNGRSKSFQCLATASLFSSIKDIAKPENAYTRERRNRVAHNVWDKNRSSYPRLSDRCGISKRPISSSRRPMPQSRSSSISSTNSNSSFNSKSPPNLHLRSSSSHNNLAVFSSPQPSRKSFSLPDLQRHFMLDQIDH